MLPSHGRPDRRRETERSRARRDPEPASPDGTTIHPRTTTGRSSDSAPSPGALPGKEALLSCPEVRGELGHYREGTLTPGLREALRRHLSRCAACRELLVGATALGSPG